MYNNLDKQSLKNYLDQLAQKYETPEFIEDDPISVPHRFTKLQDIEISGLIAATLAWGQRKTIVKNANRFIELMDNDPFNFVKNHQESDRKVFQKFVHRTFNEIDAYNFLEFFKKYYSYCDTFEAVFVEASLRDNDISIVPGLSAFKPLFMSLSNAEARTQKHVASPIKNSACKRLCMFLRWMVRSSDKQVDFGLWKKIGTQNLLIPLDVHVARQARQLHLLTHPKDDFTAVKELTQKLKEFDPIDPVKYDFALFRLGIDSK